MPENVVLHNIWHSALLWMCLHTVFYTFPSRRKWWA